MRGIEAALRVLAENSGDGVFASEALRKLADRTHMKAPDISLASSLIYIVMRRKELWEKISADYIRSREKLPPSVYMAVIMGTGGILELRRFSGGVLINGIIEYLKRDKSLVKYAGLVNAVLHKVIEEGTSSPEKFRRSPSVEGRAMYAGVPVWTLPAWQRTWSRTELNEIFSLMDTPSYSSLRPSPGKTDELLRLLNDNEIRAEKSDISSALHVNASLFPAKVPGFNEGLCTIQSESSILTASLVKKFYSGGVILDMCSGRGVKAGQILQECESAKIECWELSEKRSHSAENELHRLGVVDRAIMKSGDAMTLEPFEVPSFVVVDAPCSCSGTWNRKPESKWRLDWQKFDSMTQTQKKLLERAVKLCRSGGYVLYITCSMLKQENENIIADVLHSCPECAEVSGLISWQGQTFRKGKPYGWYIMPRNSWLDGFYCALIMKR